MPLIIVRQDDAQAIVVQPITERFGRRNAATSHPIEQGTPITDHVQPLPDTYTATTIAIGQAAADALQTFLVESRGRPLDLQTVRGGVLRNMVVTEYNSDGQASNGIPFSLAFQQVRIAVPITVTVAPLTVRPVVASGGPDTADVGVQSPTTTSLLYDLAGALGIVEE